MKILIPMAGAGSRFAKEGYTFPKPLIDVNGKPMIQAVVENLDFNNEYIFLVRKEHIKKYDGILDTLQRITNGRCSIVEVDGLTEGAACTALLAKDLIDSEEDLLIANSDQIISYQPENFKMLKALSGAGGIVFTKSIDEIKKNNINLNEELKKNNSYDVLKKINSLVIIKGTNTNVADIQILLLL